MKKWGKKELNIMLEFYTDVSFEEVCKMLPKRTPNAVKKKAPFLRLSLWAPLEKLRVITVANMLQVNRNTVLNMLKAGTLKGEKIGKCWYVDDDSIPATEKPPEWQAIDVMEASDILKIAPNSVSVIAAKGWIDSYKYGPYKKWMVRKTHIMYGVKLMATKEITKIPWYKLREYISKDTEFKKLHNIKD